ncbi:MAG: transaldolase [Deltaproteobacteria bacterium]|nr:transaldolase [Deltaproteobacteria bacterium]
MNNPLLRLRDLGQSIWLDYIRRDLFDGDLDRMIESDGLAGMTSNPTIFDQAIGQTDLYDAMIRACDRGMSPDAVFEKLAVADVREAADHFRPLYDRTDGRDGFVSIEVRPELAHDTEGTVGEARRLWRACDRPNVMVKIPGTREGLPAIRQCLAEGVNINVTLLFSVHRYVEVIDAWFSAFEERVGRGDRVDRLASVASFFVSRVDSKVDGRLETRLAQAKDERERTAIRDLLGQIGIANAKVAYQRFEEHFRSPRFAALELSGARLQRPLWASTSTKDPKYPDVYYVHHLIAPDTVNTIPPITLQAFRDHGEPAVRIHDGVADAHRALRSLESLGIDYDAVTRELEEEGVEKFGKSYADLLATIAAERARSS